MLSSLLTLASGSKKSLFFTDYMNEPRASRRSRCNSSSTAPHIRSPRPHTPSSFPYPGHPPTHPHSLTFLPSHLHTWAFSTARAQKFAVCMPCTFSVLVLSQRPCARPRRSVCTLTVLCILVHTFLYIFACSVSPLPNVFAVVFSFPLLFLLPFFFPLTRELF